MEYLREDVLQNYDFQIVVYDQIEKFREYDDPQFSYPFDQRKIKANSFTLETTHFELRDEEHNGYVVGASKWPINYSYMSQKVTFRKSYVCLESHYTSTVVDFYPSVKAFFLKSFSLTEDNLG